MKQKTRTIRDLFLIAAGLLALVPSASAAWAVQWTAPVEIVAGTGDASVVVPGDLIWWKGKLAVSFAYVGGAGDCWIPGVAIVDPRTASSTQLWVQSEDCGRYTTAPIVIGDRLYLAWARLAGTLPDGFDRGQVVIAPVFPDSIGEAVVVADSIRWKNTALSSAGGVGYVVATQSYYGAPYLDASFLWVIQPGTQVLRRPLPHGEWEQPSIWCVDSVTVHVAAWSGYAIRYVYTTDSGLTWEYPLSPARSGAVQNMVVAVGRGDRRFLFWNEDVGGNMFPDALYVSTTTKDSTWSEPTPLYLPAQGYDKWPLVDDVTFVDLRRFGYGVAAFWFVDIWTAPKTYLSFWRSGRWQAPQRVFSDWPPEGTLANCRAVSDAAGRVYLVGTLPVGESGGKLIFTKTTGPLTSIAEWRVGCGSRRARFALAVRPTPFNGSTRVRYTLPRAATVSLRVLDVLGKPVRVLARGQQAAGEHTVRWDGRDDAGQPLPSGVYLIRLEAGGQVATRKVVLVR